MEKLYTTPTTYFVKAKRDVAATVFEKGGTASGSFKKTKRGVTFYKPNGDPFAYLCTNVHPFFVTCSRHSDGRIRYMHGLCGLDEDILGITNWSWGEQRRLATRLWNELTASSIA